MMKPKVVFISSIVIIFSSFILVYLFLIKPNKTFEFKQERLISIELENIDETVYVKQEDIELFLKDFNKLKYKEKNTKVKTKGSYFVTLIYENGTFEIGKYYSTFNEENKLTLFGDTFDNFIDNWIEKYN